MAVLVCVLMSMSACACLDDTSRVKRDISEKWFWQPIRGSYFTSFIFFLPSHIWFHLFSPYLCISIHLGPKQGCLGATGWNQRSGGHEDINAFFHRLKARKTFLLHSETVQRGIKGWGNKRTHFCQLLQKEIAISHNYFLFFKGQARRLRVRLCACVASD